MNTQHEQSGVSEDEVSVKLLRHGIKPTAQRIFIAQLLFSGKTHMSAEEIFSRVNADSGAEQRASKATVYNTLGLFAEKGLVKEVIADPSKVFYDSNTEPHHHFYDAATGELIDIHEHEIHMSGLPKTPEGKVVDGVDIIIRLRAADA